MTKSFGPTHREKIFWPQAGYTKGDLIDYYERIAPTILPYLKDRPVVLKRFPNGIKQQSFFQKNLSGTPPFFVKTATLRAKNGRDIRYVLCNNRQTLAYVANLAAIELHPWSSLAKRPNYPDAMIFDLDPGPQTTFDDVIEAACAVRALLDELRLPSCVKTSGKRGMHVSVPLTAKSEYDDVRRYALALSHILAARHPQLLTATRGEEHRLGKIFIDYLRNAEGQTAVAPYSLRATSGATVSTPLEWSEVKKGLDPAKFTIKTIWKRLEKKGDLWHPMFEKKVDLKESIRRLQKELR
ncbi:MAG TPA: non-homologous end-joining DNA ligase [Candidatus Paceibacterota bacterium]|nr:non-homologous end-joining DNA ligase [Candidatus Paceibacterota bacterium]